MPGYESIEDFKGGTCIILRLSPSDYHRFCYFDNGELISNNYIEGSLHSVQPTACISTPVYILNRRLWSHIKSESFGDVLQIEVGAMLVGGINIYKSSGKILRGEEMGRFELNGSTIVMLFKKDTVTLSPALAAAKNGECEIQVKIGDTIGHGYNKP